MKHRAVLVIFVPFLLFIWIVDAFSQTCATTTTTTTTSTPSSCQESCAEGSHPVEEEGSGGKEDEDYYYDADLGQEYTRAVFSLPSAPSLVNDSSISVDRAGGLLGVVTGGVRHGGLFNVTPLDDYQPTEVLSTATVTEHFGSQVGDGVFSVEISERGGTQRFPGLFPVGVLCEGSNECDISGDSCGGGHGVCQTFGSASSSGSYNCLCVERGGFDATTSNSSAGETEALESGEEGVDDSPKEDFSLFKSLPDTLRGSPNADDFNSINNNNSGGSTARSSSSSPWAAASGIVSSTALRRKTPDGDWHFASFRETGIAFFLSRDRRTLVAQKPGRMFLEYEERIPGSRQYRLKRELGPWGEVRQEHLYDSAGNRTGVRYGRGLERTFTWESASLLRIELYTYSGEDYDPGTKKLFATEYRGYQAITYPPTGASVKRLLFIRYPSTNYVDEQTGSPFYDDSNVLSAHRMLEFTHDSSNTFVIGAKVVRVTSSGTRLREEPYFSATWRQDPSAGGAWRINTTTGANGITSSYAFNTIPNSSGRTSMVVTTPALETKYEYDTLGRLVRRRLRSLLNPRGTEDSERWVNYEYAPGTRTGRLLTRMTKSSGITRRWEYHPQFGVVTKEYVDDPTGPSGELFTEHEYSPHPLDGPRLKKTTSPNGSSIEYHYSDFSTRMPWDVGFGIASKKRVTPQVTLASGALQTVQDQEFYDAKGRLRSSTTPGGVTTTYSYDESKRGLLDSASSGAGNPLNRSFVWYERDGNGFITDIFEGGAESDRGDRSKFIHKSYTRDPYGSIDELVKHNGGNQFGRHFKYYRDWLERDVLFLAKNKNPDGQSPVDALGNGAGMEYTRSENHFDIFGRIKRSVEYRGPLFLSENQARLDLLANYEINEWMYSPSNGALLTYSNGQMSKNYTSDGYGEYYEMKLDSGEVLSRRSYNHSNNIRKREWLSSVDAGGGARYVLEELTYDRGYLRKMASIAGAENSSLHFTHNQLGSIATVRYEFNGQDKQIYEYEFDELGRQIRTFVEGREGGGSERIMFQEKEYNLFSYPDWIANHRGEQVSFEYDDIGRLRSSFFGDMGVAYSYVPHRNWVESYTDVVGGKSYKESYEYDPLGNLVKLRQLGLTGSGSPSPLETEFFYNSYGLIDRVQYPDQKVFEWSRALDGFVFLEIPTHGEPYFIEQRRLGSVSGDVEVQAVDPAGRVTSYKYDRLNLLRSIQYPDAKAVNYEYDGAFRLKNVLRPGSSYKVNSRFHDGKLKQAVFSDSRGQITRDFYRQAGRPFKVTESGPNSTSLVQWSYDRFGSLLREDVQFQLHGGFQQFSSAVVVNKRDSSGAFDFRTHGVAIHGNTINDVSLELGYDGFDRVNSIGYVSGQYSLPSTVATFGYEGENLVSRSSLSGALATTNHFDLFNRQEGSTTSLNGGYVDGYFVYRNLMGDVHREISLFSPNGGSGRSFRYDNFHRPVEEVDGVSLQQLLSEPNFANLNHTLRTTVGFSNGGNSEIPLSHRIQRDSGAGGYVDELSRSYQVDSKKGIVTGGQQLTGGFSILYDEVGNVVRDESAADGAGRIYQYDALDRLILVKDLNGSVISRYGYDPSNRLVAIADSSGAITHNIYHHWKLLADESSSGRTRFYSYVPHGMPDQLLGLYVGDSAGGEFYSITNSQDGSPSAAIRHSDGQVAERYKFNMFGGLPRIYDSNGAGPQLVSAIGNPFGEKGTYWDAESQLYLNRKRARDPYNSRFLQRDPVVRHMLDGFDEYAVFGNNSLSNLDPNGGQWWRRFHPEPNPNVRPRPHGDGETPPRPRPHADDGSGAPIRPVPRSPGAEPAPGAGRPTLPPVDDGLPPRASGPSHPSSEPSPPQGSGAGSGGGGKGPDTDGSGNSGGGSDGSGTPGGRGDSDAGEGGASRTSVEEVDVTPATAKKKPCADDENPCDPEVFYGTPDQFVRSHPIPQGMTSEGNAGSTVRKYAKKIAAGEDVQPIWVIEHECKLYIVNGHHRFYAYKRMNAEKIPYQRFPKDHPEIVDSGGWEKFVEDAANMTDPDHPKIHGPMPKPFPSNGGAGGGGGSPPGGGTPDPGGN